MKFHHAVRLSVVIVSLFYMALSHATLIITLDAPLKVMPNTNFEVIIALEGLDPTAGLGAFSFSFSYTPRDNINFLAHASSFGDGLGDVSLGEALIGLTQTDLGVDVKRLDVFEFSLLFPLPLQAANLTLLTLGFYAPGNTNPGSLQMGILVNNFVFGDSLGNPLSLDNDQVGAFVIITEVAEPSILLLLSVGLLSLQWTRRYSRACYKTRADRL